MFHKFLRSVILLVMLDPKCSGHKCANVSLQGVNIRVVAQNMMPYIAFNNDTQLLVGYLGDIWYLIKESLAFKMTLTTADYDTGLEMIEKNEADILLAAAVAKSNLKNVYFSQPYIQNWYHLYLKTPEAKPSCSSYLKTFSPQLWLTILLASCIQVAFLWLTSNFLSRAYRSESRLSLPACVLAVLSGFLNQGYDVKLRSFSGRMQQTWALLLGLLMYSAMGASLFAQLTVLITPLPFKSLDDLALTKTHSLCLRNNSFVYNNFTDENQNILPKWQGILNGKGCLDTIDQKNIPKIICRDDIIIFENRVVMEDVIRYNNIPCNVFFQNTKYFERSNYFIFSKKFFGRNLILSKITHLENLGIASKLRKKWMPQGYIGRQIGRRVAKEKSVITMDHIRGVIILYLAFLVISLIVLGCEYICLKWF